MVLVLCYVAATTLKGGAALAKESRVRGTDVIGTKPLLEQFLAARDHRHSHGSISAVGSTDEHSHVNWIHE